MFVRLQSPYETRAYLVNTDKIVAVLPLEGGVGIKVILSPDFSEFVYANCTVSEFEEAIIHGGPYRDLQKVTIC